MVLTSTMRLWTVKHVLLYLQHGLNHVASNATSFMDPSLADSTASFRERIVSGKEKIGGLVENMSTD